MSKDIVGKRIKELREQKGLMQVEVAKYLDLDKATVSGYERGVSFPSVDILIKMVELFDTSADYLLGIDVNKSLRGIDLSPTREAFLLNTIEFLTQEQKEADEKKDN